LLQAPVTAHRSGRGIVSEALPYGFSCGEAIAKWMETDVLIGIGSRLELQYLRWRTQPPSLKVVRIDIDPAEFERLPPTVGLVTDARLGTTALLDALATMIAPRASRETEFMQAKHVARSAFRRVQPQMAYLDVIRQVLPVEGFFVEEITQTGFAARFGFPVYAPRTYVTCGYQDNLGFGFNTALGVKVAQPHRPVLAIAGDGGFLYGLQELATAVHHQINLVTCVFDNGGFGNVRRDQTDRFGGRVIGADLTNPNFVQLAESFGIAGYAVDSPERLRPVLEHAFTANAPAVIHIRVPRDTEVSPWRFLHPQF
jgi:acetolactate synthase-1/2/3 large subunit